MKRSVQLRGRKPDQSFRRPGTRRRVRSSRLLAHRQPGEILSLLGPSGCGKTTLLRMLAGFEEATAGTIRVDGQTVQHLPAHKRDMAMVFQTTLSFPISASLRTLRTALN